MDPGMIRGLRRGQAEERDDRLAALLVSRLLIDEETLRGLREGLEPGTLGEALVRSGRLSAEQHGALRDESERRETLSRFTPPPDEVGAALKRGAERLGKYVLVKKVGEGGMGDVWMGWDEELARLAAVKLLKEVEPQAVERFLREAALAARLSHPGIVRVYDIGVEGERPYLAMEFVDGRSLEDVVLPRRRAAEVVRDAARAIQHAHEDGIVHRDLKPSNVMESRDGRVLVADFGLARPLSQGMTITASGAVVGSPAFMSPEQASVRPADARTDVYGLGATLYALLTGKPPFDGDSLPDVLWKIVHVPAPHIEPRDDLAVVVAKALEKERADRYPTAGDLADDLERWLEGAPINARPVSWVGRAWRRARRHPRRAAAWALGLLLVASGTALATARISRDGARREAERRSDLEVARAQDLNRRLRTLPPNAGPTRDRVIEEVDRLSAEALRLAPNHPPALHLRAEFLSILGRAEEALALLDHLLAVAPEHAEGRALRGLTRLAGTADIAPTVHMVGGLVRFEPPEMTAALERTIATSLEDFEALPEPHPSRTLAVALPALFRGDYEEVRTTVSAAVERAPQDFHLRTLLLWADLYEGRYEEARGQADEFIRSGLFLALAHDARAFARAGLGDLEGAVEDATRALDLDASRGALRTLRGHVLVRLGRPREALPDYDALVAAAPDSAGRLRERSFARRSAGDREGALADADAAIARAPEDAQAHVERAEALEDAREAIASYSRAIALDPTLSAAFIGRGIRRFALAEVETGRADLRRAMALEPEEPRYGVILGLSELASGDAQAAEAVLDEVVRRHPSNARALEARGNARQYLGDAAGARSDYEAAMAIDPSLAPRIAPYLEQLRSPR